MKLHKTYVVVTLTNSELDLKESWIKIQKLKQKKYLDTFCVTV